MSCLLSWHHALYIKENLLSWRICVILLSVWKLKQNWRNAQQSYLFCVLLIAYKIHRNYLWRNCCLHRSKQIWFSKKFSFISNNSNAIIISSIKGLIMYLRCQGLGEGYIYFFHSSFISWLFIISVNLTSL